MAIDFPCPRCENTLSADDSLAGQQVECPHCKTSLLVPGSGRISGPPWYAKAFPPTAIIAILLLIWAVVATAMVRSRSADLRRTRYELHQMESNIDKFEEDAQLAKEEAERIRREAQGFALLQEENLNEQYPSLRKYKPGRNEVGHQYLEAFEVERNRIKTFMRNRTSTSARPNFDILFLTKYGFVTDSFSKSWLLDSMAPGQSRIDDDTGIYWRFGEPVYYTITFNN